MIRTTHTCMGTRCRLWVAMTLCMIHFKEMTSQPDQKYDFENEIITHSEKPIFIL